MPNLNVQGDYRYGYQGEYAETDPETGKVAFELRLYDPRINRWLTTDPANQYHSPYMSMGNNWINKVDPDGAKADDWVLRDGQYVWDENVTSASDPDLLSTDQYVGIGISDVRQHFQDNNNWFQRLGGLNLDTSSYTDYLDREFTGRLQNLIDTGEAQRFDNIRGLYENWSVTPGGTANGFYVIKNPNLIVDGGIPSRGGEINLQVYKTKQKWNIISTVESNHRTYNEILQTSYTFPYQWRIYSHHMESDDRIPIFTLQLPFNSTNSIFADRLDGF